jgi:hypothetical protein
MVKIYTNKKHLKGIDGIDFPDPYFNRFVGNTKKFENREIDFLKEFEQASIIGEDALSGRFADKNNNKFDLFRTSEISSGVKVVLLLSLMERGKIGKQGYINVTECGANVLPVVFDLADKIGMPCIVQHMMFDEVPDREYLLNGIEIIKSTAELIDKIVESDDYEEE